MADHEDGANAASNSDALSARMAELRMPKEATTLLSLPGEIRNKIYDHCYEVKALIVRPDYYRSRKVGQFRSLTQVSRCIREEFRPLYTQKTTYELYFPEDLNGFINAFYPRNVESHVLKGCRGIIIVPIFHSLVDPEIFNIEIGNLFHLVSKAPGVHFTFKRHKSMPAAPEPQVAQLNSFLRSLQDVAHPTWRDFIQDATPEIELAVERSSMQINFLLKDYSEVTAYKNTIFEWWATGSEPSRTIRRLTVSSGISYDDILERQYNVHDLRDDLDPCKQISEAHWLARRG